MLDEEFIHKHTTTFRKLVELTLFHKKGKNNKVFSTAVNYDKKSLNEYLNKIKDYIKEKKKDFTV